MNELIRDFQLHLMQQRFLKMDAEDAAWVRGKSIHSWTWSIMKRIHSMNTHDRDLLLIRMVGDYKIYALNPSGRKDPVFGLSTVD